MLGKPTIRPSEIDDVFIMALAFLVPFLNRVAEDECKMSVGQIFVMLHLLKSGKTVDERPTMLRNDLTKLLRGRGFTESGASRLLQELEIGGFVERRFITPAVRQETFEPADRAYTLAVMLKPEGNEKIALFKAALRQHFANWVDNELKDKNQKERMLLASGFRKLLQNKVAQKLAASLVDRLVSREMPKSEAPRENF